VRRNQLTVAVLRVHKAQLYYFYDYGTMVWYRERYINSFTTPLLSLIKLCATQLMNDRLVWSRVVFIASLRCFCSPSASGNSCSVGVRIQSGRLVGAEKMWKWIEVVVV